MKLVPAFCIAAMLSVTASAADVHYSTYRTAPVVGQTIGFLLHSDSSGCSTCAPTCAAPAEPSCCAPAEPSCCAPAEPSCCAPAEPSCCAPAEPSCCAPAEPSCCAPAEPSCCAPAEPSCCAPEACCEPTCAAPSDCWQPKKDGLFSRIMNVERRKNNWLLGLIGR